jgi:uncharacterized membrane protein HdeD (DUF308 family)
MTDMTATSRNVVASMQANWGWLLALGIVFLIGGILAIAAPGIASITVTLVVAVVFVWIGIMQVIQAFSDRSWGGFAWQLIIGIVILLGGIAVYWNPLLGTLTLTLVVAAMFIAKGIFQLILGFRMRPHGGSGWIIAAGILSILVGVLIWAGWPISGLWALGTLAGISLIFTGWSYIAMALAVRRVA